MIECDERVGDHRLVGRAELVLEFSVERTQALSLELVADGLGDERADTLRADALANLFDDLGVDGDGDPSGFHSVILPRVTTAADGASVSDRNGLGCFVTGVVRRTARRASGCRNSIDDQISGPRIDFPRDISRSRGG